MSYKTVVWLTDVGATPVEHLEMGRVRDHGSRLPMVYT